MKTRETLIVIFALVVELSLFAPFFSKYFLSILPAAVLYFALCAKDEHALVSVFTIGFLVDLACLNKALPTTIFLMTEFVVAYFARQKVIDFRNPASLFLFVASFSIIRLFLEMFIHRGFVDTRQTIFAVLINILISLILSLFVYKLSRIYKINEA